MDNFGRIGILLGGPSSERDISLKSGEAVYASLIGQQLDAFILDIPTDNPQDNLRLIQQARIDIAFIALHGRYGEDGSLQSLLEGLGLPYTGSGPAASRLSMDKIAARGVFCQNGLSVPRSVNFAVDDKEDIAEAAAFYLSAPYVVKPAAQGSSIGLSIVRRPEELKAACKRAFEFDRNIIVEEYIAGREITVGIIGDVSLPVLEVIPQNEFYDYEAKYTPGKSRYVVPACLPSPIAAEVQRIALSAHQTLGCAGFSRVDMRLSNKNIPYVLEVNSIPGLTPTSLLPKAAAAAGIDFNQLCLNILRFAYQRFAKIRSAAPATISKI